MEKVMCSTCITRKMQLDHVKSWCDSGWSSPRIHPSLGHGVRPCAELVVAPACRLRFDLKQGGASAFEPVRARSRRVKRRLLPEERVASSFVVNVMFI
ncbi:hypothetical protein ACVWZK_001823 [Bradyrhizobium sp. GM0.4]